LSFKFLTFNTGIRRLMPHKFAWQMAKNWRLQNASSRTNKLSLESTVTQQE